MTGQPQILVVARDCGGGNTLVAQRALPGRSRSRSLASDGERSRAFLDNIGKSLRAIRGLVQKVLRGQQTDVFRIREGSLEAYLP